MKLIRDSKTLIIDYDAICLKIQTNLKEYEMFVVHFFETYSKNLLGFKCSLNLKIIEEISKLEQSLHSASNLVDFTLFRASASQSLS